MPAHGGNLFAARQAYPQAPEPWLDLSTGINPYPYPFPNPPPESFVRLPEQEAIRSLEAAAASAYRTPFTAETIAAPGSQAIINWLPHLVSAKRVGILGVTYSEYAPRWAAAGAKVTMAHDVAELERQDVAIVVNPNNPDGRLVPAADLHAVGTALAERGGLLIVDEAFVDFLEPGVSAVPGMPEQGMIILRSFGKAYGLPGTPARFRGRAESSRGETSCRIRSLAGLGRRHRDRFKSLTRSCLARGRVDAPHGTGLGARQHTGCGRFFSGWQQCALPACVSQ